MNLLDIYHRYEAIMQADQDELARTKALSGLMTEMEHDGVPILQNVDWESHHRLEAALYRRISESRNALWICD